MCKIREVNLETAKYYGYEAQSNQLVEECAELIHTGGKQVPQSGNRLRTACSRG